MTGNDRRVAIITGGSQGIGASLVAGYLGRGWAVVANARTIGPSADPDVLTVEGDIAKPATADRIVEGALERFGRIDTVVNNAGVFVSKPFTDYTAADYALLTGVNLGSTPSRPASSRLRCTRRTATRDSVTSFLRSGASARSGTS
jgi:NAD(P)-dependent dehydrogenase (short-subunit alcohol dehydrogenase family)